MNTIVVFYSRKGTTKKVGELIAKELNCDVEEIFNTKKRTGLIGWLKSGRDAMRGSLTTLEKIDKDVGSYDLIIIGTPIWSRRMSTPIKTFISENKSKFKSVAFFATEGSKGGPQAFEGMTELCGKEPKSTLEINKKDMKKGVYVEKVNEFVQKLR